MTRRLIDNLREGWALLDRWVRAGIIAFELAWLVQMYVLARLFLG